MDQKDAALDHRGSARATVILWIFQNVRLPLRILYRPSKLFVLPIFIFILCESPRGFAQSESGPSYVLEGTVGTSSLMNKRGVAFLIGAGLHASLNDNRLHFGTRMGASDDTLGVVYSYSDVQLMLFQTLWGGNTYKLDIGAGLGYYWYIERAGSINQKIFSILKFPAGL